MFEETISIIKRHTNNFFVVLDFFSSKVLLELTPSDFPVRQEWLFHERNDLYDSVTTDLGYTSFPLIYHMLILLAIQSG